MTQEMVVAGTQVQLVMVPWSATPVLTELDAGILFGYSRPRNLRKLVFAHAEELRAFGPFCGESQQNAELHRNSGNACLVHVNRGRPKSADHYFNREHMILLSMWVDTATAEVNRARITRVFAAHLDAKPEDRIGSGVTATELRALVQEVVSNLALPDDAILGKVAADRLRLRIRSLAAELARISGKPVKTVLSKLHNDLRARLGFAAGKGRSWDMLPKAKFSDADEALTEFASWCRLGAAADPQLSLLRRAT